VAEDFVLYNGEQRHAVQGVRALNPLREEEWLSL
jgi:hypothetical protein